MKFLLRLFKIFAGLLLVTILGLIGVFVFFKNIDLAPYDSLIKGQVEAKTGRLLRIDGQTKLDLSLSPALVMTDIGLANASWGQNPELISVGRLYGKLRLLPLLMGKFEVETLALEKVQIHLEQTPEGVRNYRIKSPKPNLPKPNLPNQAISHDGKDASPKTIPKEVSQSAPPVIENATSSPRLLMKSVTLQDVIISFHDGQDQQTSDVKIDRVELSHSEEKQAYMLSAFLRFRKIDLAMSAQIRGRNFADIIGSPVTFAAQGTVDELPWEATGNLQDSALKLDFQAEIDDLSHITPLLRQGLDVTHHSKIWVDGWRAMPKFGQIRVVGQIEGQIDGKIALPKIEVVAGEDGQNSLSLRGRVEDVSAFAGVDLALKMVLADRGYQNSVSYGQGAAEPISLAARLTDQKETGNLSLNDFSFQSPHSDLRGNIVWQRNSVTPNISANFRSQHLDLEALKALLLTFKHAPPSTAEISAPTPRAEQASNNTTALPQNPNKARKLLFPRKPLAIPDLSGVIADLGIAIKHLRIGTIAVKNIQGNVELGKNNLIRSDFQGNLGDGQFAINNIFDANRQKPSLTMTVDGENIALASLITPMRQQAVISGPLSGKVRFETAGLSMAEFAANLTGKAELMVLDGKIHTEAIRKMLPDGERDVLALLVGDWREDIPLYCLVSDINFTNGKGLPRHVFLESPHFRLSADGHIDLTDQTLDVQLVPYFAKVSMPFQVKGWLESPRLVLQSSKDLAKIALAIYLGEDPSLSDEINPQPSASSDHQMKRDCIAYGSKMAVNAGQKPPLTNSPHSQLPKIQPEDALKGLLKRGLKDLLGR